MEKYNTIRRILEDKELKGASKLLLIYLLSLVTLTTDMCNSQLAEKIGVDSVRTIQRALKELQEKKLIYFYYGKKRIIKGMYVGSRKIIVHIYNVDLKYKETGD